MLGFQWTVSYIVQMQSSLDQKASGKLPLQTVLLTTLAMIAFAANSIICRVALKEDSLDAASFTTVRLLTGALTLWLIVSIRRTGKQRIDNHARRSAIMLALYAVSFSFAYINLNIATGALILFGAVQATMMLKGFLSGERLDFLEWIGFTTAFTGLLVLVFPGLTAPSPTGAILMLIAGIGWGSYSVLGRRSQNPIDDSAINFLLAAPICLAVSIFMYSALHITVRGLLLASLSGSIMTGCAYVVWYKALSGLTVIRASIVQLSVPVLAALGGIFLLDEPLSLRIIIAGILILGGVGLGLGGLSKRRGTA